MSATNRTTPKHVLIACDFIRDLSGKRVFVIYHDDCDGVSSAALLLNHFSKDSNPEAFCVRNVPRVTEDLMSEILEKHPDSVILVDFAENVDKSARKFIDNGIKCLVIDHHIPRDYSFPKEAVYSNPHLDKLSMPATAYVYEILSCITDVDDHLWIAAAGTIADFGASDRPDLIEMCMKRYPDLFEYKGLDNSKLFDTTFGKIPNCISSASVWGSYKGIEFALRCMLSCRNPYEFLSQGTDNLKTLFRNYEDVEKEVRLGVDAFWKKHITDGRVKYMVLESRYHIKSIVSTIVSPKDNGFVFILIQDAGEDISMSFRNQSGDYDLNSIIQKASEGLDAGGGGHKKASGATVSKKDYKEFLGRILGLVNKS